MSLKLSKHSARRRRSQRKPLSPLSSTARAGSGTLSNEFLDETIREWQPFASAELTREDAREIIYNITGFMSVLMRWREAEKLEGRASL